MTIRVAVMLAAAVFMLLAAGGMMTSIILDRLPAVSAAPR
jgi:hypothetical protein